MRIEYLGHSCFYCVDSGGISCIIDPYDETVGYKPLPRGARYTLVSHSHWDHGHVAAVPGATHVVTGSGNRGTDEFPVRGVLACHDAVGGRERGMINMYCFAMDGVRVCHLSDLGHLLDPAQLKEIGAVDVLLVPVGGGSYTIDAAAAHQITQQLQPRAVIPMHYMTAQTNRSDFPIDGVEPFLKRFRHVQTVRSGEVEFLPKTLPIQLTVYHLTNTR